MIQKDVDRLAFKSAAAMMRDADFQIIFGDSCDWMDETQMEKAQQRVVEFLEKKSRGS